MAPAPKTKSSPTNGAAPKNKQTKGDSKDEPAANGEAPTATNGKAVPADETATSAEGSRGRPDKAAYDAEMSKIKAEIDVKQVEKGKLEEQIKSLQGGGAGDKKKSLYDELAELQSGHKSSRSSIREQIDSKKEALSKKKKDLQTAKGKVQWRNVQELDAHLKHLQKQVESGSMKLVEEKRALADITTTKRLRKTLEGFQGDQDAIDKDQSALDELHKQVEDPDKIAAHNRMDAIRSEIAQIKKDTTEFSDSKNKLYDRRSALKTELDELYGRKRDCAQSYKDGNDRYYAKVREEQARRQERFRAQRQADDEAKKKEFALLLREEAETPAFQLQIEDCQTLVDYFLGKGTGIKEKAPVVKANLAGVPELELRQVQTAPSKGFITSKKKGEEEEVYFAAKTKSKVGRGNKGVINKLNGTAAADTANGQAAPLLSDKLNLPLTTLNALLEFSIPPPSSSADVPRTIEDLRTKKAWYEANQPRVTAENIAKADAKVQKLMNASKDSKGDDPLSLNAVPPNGDGEKPSEPIPTPVVTDTLSVGVESEKVDEILDGVQKEVDDES